MKEKDVVMWIVVGVFLFIMLIIGAAQDGDKNKSSTTNEVIQLKADRYKYEAEQKRVSDYIEFEAQRKAR